MTNHIPVTYDSLKLVSRCKTMSEEPLRLSKLMAQRGLCSRREADAFIERGLVFVDGVRVSTLGVKVLPTQIVTLDPQATREQQGLATILLNKPIAYVSGQPEEGYLPAASLITAESQSPEWPSQPLKQDHFRGLAPAGRLDIDSRGLLVFTQDGRLAKQLTGEDSELDKEYLVRVSGTLDSTGLSRLRHGLELDGRPLKPAHVEWLNADQLRFILHEGKKRQVRRMCEAVGLTVTGLKRVRIGRVMLGKLAEGQWRFLQPGEVF